MIDFFSALGPDVACMLIFCVSGLIFTFLVGIFVLLHDIFY